MIPRTELSIDGRHLQTRALLRACTLALGTALATGCLGSPIVGASDADSERAALHLAGGGEDSLRWGPAAFDYDAVARYAVDNVRHQVVMTPRAGGPSSRLALPAEATGVLDLVSLPTGVAILARGSESPRVWLLSRDGAVLGSWSVPESYATGLSGLAALDGGRLAIEAEGGARLLSLDVATGALAPVDGYALAGHTVHAMPADLTSQATGVGEVNVDGRSFVVSSINLLAGLEVLGAAADGSVWLRVTEARLLPIVVARVTVRRYTSAGELLAWAEVAPDATSTAPRHELALTPEGQPVHMTYGDSVRFAPLSLRPASELEALALPGTLLAFAPEDGSYVRLVERISCIRAAQVMANVSEYLNYRTTYPATARTACTGRTAPAWLTGAGPFSSIPYTWGGEDSPAEFGSALLQGARAGDVDTNSTLCGGRNIAGVDCSGFVGRVWGVGRGAKQGTSTMWRIATELCPSSSNCRSPVRGDAYNYPGSHILLFDSVATGGAQVYEAAGYSRIDRVVPSYYSTSRLRGYRPFRYNQFCP